MNPQGNANPIPRPPASSPDAAGTAPRDARGGPARIAWLFRTSLRAGRVHPLQPMLQRYRSGEER